MPQLNNLPNSGNGSNLTQTPPAPAAAKPDFDVKLFNKMLQRQAETNYSKHVEKCAQESRTPSNENEYIAINIETSQKHWKGKEAEFIQKNKGLLEPSKVM